MSKDVYRNSSGRFASEKAATFKQSGGKHFVRLFGSWMELTPVTPDRMRQVADAQTRAATATEVFLEPIWAGIRK